MESQGSYPQRTPRKEGSDALKNFYRLYSSLPRNERHLTRARIDLDALAHNWRVVRDAVGRKNVRMIAVVKADAYGHGAPACVATLLAEGCDFFAVSCIDEAATVRATCREEGAHADVLILGYTPPSLVGELSRLDVVQTLLSEEHANALSKVAAEEGVALRTHIAVDTGMNRIGLAAYDESSVRASAEAIHRIRALPGLSVEGMFTHFARADEEGGEEFTARQAERYLALRRTSEEMGDVIGFHHVCNSAATARFPDLHFDGVRPGILLYGVLPTKKPALPLRPVLRLTTAVMHLHTLLPGEGVGYGSTYRATGERRIATLPIGYADGFLRDYSGAEVTVHSKAGSFRAPIVGRICMDQCMIDVTGHEVSVGDEITLFGLSPSDLADFARRANTIEYECLCILSSRVPRSYITAEPEERHL